MMIDAYTIISTVGAHQAYFLVMPSRLVTGLEHSSLRCNSACSNGCVQGHRVDASDTYPLCCIKAGLILEIHWADFCIAG